MNSCIYCDYEDTLTMVQCDDCNRWAHFECAGVDERIENYPWSCVMCLEKSLEEWKEKLERKEKEVQEREKELEEKEMEVDEIIQEAIESIKNEFQTKTVALKTMEMDAKEKLTEADRMTKDMEIRENALKEREARIEEREANVEEARANVRDIPKNTAREVNQQNFFEVLPIKESEFNAWDKLLNERKEDMIRFYLEINLKSLPGFIKQCILATFSEEFIPCITFETKGFINQANILRVLIATIHRKFPDSGLDDKDVRSKIAKTLRQYRNTESKRDN